VLKKHAVREAITAFLIVKEITMNPLYNRIGKHQDLLYVQNVKKNDVINNTALSPSSYPVRNI